MEKIILNNESIFLKRDRLGWRIINPNKNEDGTTNWINLFTGGKRNLVTLIIYVCIALIIAYGINNLVSSYQDAAENPCSYCRLAEDFHLNPEVEASLRATGDIVGIQNPIK